MRSMTEGVSLFSYRLPRASGGGVEQSETEGVLLFFPIAYSLLPIAFFKKRPPPSLRDTSPGSPREAARNQSLLNLIRVPCRCRPRLLHVLFTLKTEKTCRRLRHLHAIHQDCDEIGRHRIPYA